VPLNEIICSTNNLQCKTDESTNGRDGVFNFSPSFKELVGGKHFKEFKAVALRPNLSLFPGNYNQMVV